MARIGVAAALVILFAAIAVTPVSAGAAPPLPTLIYEVDAVFERFYPYRSYLVISPMRVEGRYIYFNVTYLLGEPVRIRDVYFIRPYNATSIVIKVDAETWEAYYGDLDLGNFLFVGLHRASRPLSSLEDGRVVYWSVVNVTLIGVVDEEGYWIPAAPVKLPRRIRAPQAYIDVARALGLRVLEVYSMRLRGPGVASCRMTFEGHSGILLSAFISEMGVVEVVGGKLPAYTNVTIFRLLGIKAIEIFISLAHVTPGETSVPITKAVEIDPTPAIPAASKRGLPIPI
ncbi:MAG: hypothetical protein DRK00_06315 [Thermoprotei archaeon]|nr:MAG: hypothetical protein DRK00_06315 [Thermoprotei archaeon]